MAKTTNIRAFPKLGRTLSVVALCAVLGCVPIPRNHGYVPTDEDLAKIAVGRDNRETVAESIGVPLNHGLEREDAWYYVSTRRQTVGPKAPEILTRNIVSIRFTSNGTVENIERFSLEDGRVVPISSRVTDPAVSDVGFLRQVFGNLGGITADQFLE